MNSADVTLSNDWIIYFLRRAETHAQMSKDPSTKCGCILVDPATKFCVSEGYNGFSASIEDRPEWYSDRPTKYKLVIHAEMNAIINSPVSTKGTHAFVTGPCCDNCAKHVVAAGITHVYWVEPSEDYMSRWAESKKIAMEIFNLGNVHVTEISREVYEYYYIRRT